MTIQVFRRTTKSAATTGAYFEDIGPEDVARSHVDNRRYDDYREQTFMLGNADYAALKAYMNRFQNDHGLMVSGTGISPDSKYSSVP